MIILVEINMAGGFSRKYICASIRTNWRRTWSQIKSRGKDIYAVYEHHNYHFKVHVRLRMTNLATYTVLQPHFHLYKLPFFPFFFVKSKHLSMSHQVFVWKASLNCNSLNCVIITQSKGKNHHSTWYNNLLQSVHFLFTFSI